MINANSLIDGIGFQNYLGVSYLFSFYISEPIMLTSGRKRVGSAGGGAATVRYFALMAKHGRNRSHKAMIPLIEIGIAGVAASDYETKCQSITAWGHGLARLSGTT